MIFAWNSQGCTVSTPVQAQTAPGVITAATFGSPSEHSGSVTWDATLAGASIGGSALTSDYTFYYSLAGGPEQGPISLGDFINGDGTQYGNPNLSVTLRACHNGACQSTPAEFALGVTPVNPQIGQLSYQANDPLSLTTGTFTWTVWPSGTYSSIQYNCGSGFQTVTDTSSAGTCTVPLLQTPQLIIRVTANGGATYDATYDQNGNVQ